MASETTSYLVRVPFATRWNDNDQYGHLNNAVYYEAMDTAVNSWMIRTAGLDPQAGSAIALCVASSCEFRESARFPEPLEVGIGVERVGTTSVRWALALVRPHSQNPFAPGLFVRVFLEAAPRPPTPVPEAIRSAIEEQLLP